MSIIFRPRIRVRRVRRHRSKAVLGAMTGRVRTAEPDSRGLSRQCFLVCNKASACDVWVVLERFVARFSFRDFPDFLVMVCRGDLSDIAAL
jgi:hypothetical protein